MNFPGTSKLVLSDDALKFALEESMNLTRNFDGEDVKWVRVLSFYKPAYGDIELTITTDPDPAVPTPDV